MNYQKDKVATLEMGKAAGRQLGVREWGRIRGSLGDMVSQRCLESQGKSRLKSVNEIKNGEDNRFQDQILRSSKIYKSGKAEKPAKKTKKE